jgi:hypothetical protein
MLLSRMFLRAGLVVGAIALPAVALAAHGKVGLWEITTHMNMPNMMANIPPDQLARMQAMGVHMPNAQTMTTQHCMTAEEVAMDKPPPMRNASDCTVSNATHDAHTYAADMVCSGQMQGHGHVSVAYDSDEHYSGSYSFSGSAHGHPAEMTTSFEGKWISADCGTTK